MHARTPLHPLAEKGEKRKRKRQEKKEGQNKTKLQLTVIQKNTAPQRCGHVEKKDSPLALFSLLYSVYSVYFLQLPDCIQLADFTTKHYWHTRTVTRCAGFGFLCVSTPVSKGTYSSYSYYYSSAITNLVQKTSRGHRGC